MIPLRRSRSLFAALLALAPVAGCMDGAADDAADADAAADAAGADAADAADVSAPDGPLAEVCDRTIGAPRVLEVAPGLHVAIGFDLANTIALTTDAGRVIIDAGMSPARAAETRAALDAVAPGPIAAVIYTHSHIDHVGGAEVWVEPGTEVWATDALLEHFLKQYGAFRPAESERARRQFGQHVPLDELPCSGIGRRADVEAALSTGFVPPTHTFSGERALTIGGVTLELVEAHGETHDQLFVWLPHLEALLPGDNFYEAFPNLYTIRGTSARPIDAWIASLDAMRARDPAVLVPSHTAPLTDRATVRVGLRDYRDAIQWLRDEVTRRANRLEPLHAIVAGVRLPDHLAGSRWLAERYGQVDWSVRGIYGQSLGWFDGYADRLYPPEDLLAREIALMGGADAVLAAAQGALTAGEARWAAHLLGKLRDAGALATDALAPRLAEAYRAVADGVANTNGRGYLLERALELEGVDVAAPDAAVGPGLVAAVPAALVLELLGARLRPEDAMDVEERLTIALDDVGETWHVTVRRGVAEVVRGAPLPGSPEPVATLTTDSATWVGLALETLTVAEALAEGTLQSDDFLAVVAFLDRFDAGI